MTLIFSYRSPITGLFSVSDILLSAPTNGLPPEVNLPFRDQPLRYQTESGALHSLGQKTTIFGRTMVSWAGREAVARSLISQIVRASNNGEDQVDISLLINNSGCLASELELVSLIYNYWSSEDRVAMSAWRCNFIEGVAGSDMYVAGRGEGYFFHNLVAEFPNFPPYEEILSAFLTKIVSHSIMERSSTDSLDFHYGGWFEIAHKADRTFKKVPYAIKMWARNEHTLSSGGPTLFGWYRDNTLIISKHNARQVGSEVVHTQRHYFVSDFLGRDGEFSPPPEPLRPYFIWHVVYDEDERQFSALLENNPNSDDMIVEVSRAGFRVAWSHALRRRLFELAPDGSTGLRRRWDLPPDLEAT